MAAALLALASVLLVRANDTDAPNLVSNPGFENGTSDWISLGGVLSNVGQPYEGDYAGAIQLSASLGVIRQDLNLQPGDAYALSGRFLYRNPPVQSVRLELSWQNSKGLLDSQVFVLTDSDGSTWLAALAQLGVLPCDAVSSQAKVTILGEPGAVVLFDDFRLKSTPSIACARPTKTPTESPIPTVTATATPQATVTEPPPIITVTRPPSRTSTVARTATTTGIAPPTSTRLTSSTPSLTPPPMTPTPSHGLVVNGGFEAIEGGQLVGWRTFGGTLIQSVDHVHSGQYASCFVSETTSTKWLYQTVPVIPGNWYEMNAYAYQNDPNVAGALLRISWYESPDATGSALSSVDSMEELTAPEDGYRPLRTGPVVAPPNAHSANARIVLRPLSVASARICVDDVSFASKSPPQPTPTAAATETATELSAPTATWPQTPTATSTVISFETQTRTASPTRTTSPTRTSTRTRTVQSLVTTPTFAASLTASPPGTATTAATLAASPTAPTTSIELPPPGELLINGNFESSGHEGLAGWDKHGGVLAQVAEPVRSGAFAAGYYSASESTKWLYQAVDVQPGAWYQFDGHIRNDDPWVAGALLRVSWYENFDGSGTEITQADSTEDLTGPAEMYRQLTTGPLRAPPNARSAAVRILLRPRDDTSAVIYVDDVSFRAVDAPEPASDDSPIDPRASDPPSGAGAGGIIPSSVSSANPGSSAVRGAAVARPPAPIVVQPTPVIRRNHSTFEAPEDLARDSGAPRWPWVVAAGAAVAAVAGAGSYVWGRTDSHLDR